MIEGALGAYNVLHGVDLHSTATFTIIRCLQLDHLRGQLLNSCSLIPGSNLRQICSTRILHHETRAKPTLYINFDTFIFFFFFCSQIPFR